MEYIIDELKQYDLNLISKADLTKNKFYIKYRNSNVVNLCLIMLCDDSEYNNLLDNVKFCDVTYFTFDSNVPIEKIMFNAYLNFCKNYSVNKIEIYTNYYLVYKKCFNFGVKISFIYQTTFECYKKKYTKFANLDNFINYCKFELKHKKTDIYYKMNSNEIYFNFYN